MNWSMNVTGLQKCKSYHFFFFQHYIFCYHSCFFYISHTNSIFYLFLFYLSFLLGKALLIFILWGLKVFSVEVTNVGFEGILGGQWLRARLCCHKISDSIFWLYYFTPRWLAGAMPCPKKVQKKYTKRKDRNRQETKTFLSYFPLFTWWIDQPTLLPKT